MNKDSISGLLLAGGRGARMGRADKGLQAFGGTTLAAHALARLAPQVATVAISANRNLDAYAAYGVPVWPDDTPGFAGPLAGLQAGLRRCATSLLLTAPCDSPFLPDDLAARLLAGLEAQGADAAVAVTVEDGQRRLHPVFCLLKASLEPALTAWLEAGGRRMEAWLREHRLAEVVFDDVPAFRNINTEDELRRLDPARPPRLADVAGCLSGYDPEALRVDDARRIIREVVAPVRAVEQVALRAALGRVLAEDVVSPIDVPAHDNSAMDGYALQGSDLRTDAPVRLRVAGTTYAGRAYAGTVQPGECIRIMTGGVMPAGCDSVVPQELVAVDGEHIVLAPGVIRAGDNRRLAGEDLAAGSAALVAGRVMRPSDLGLMASLGVAEVPVRRRLRVAFFSTGDELRSIGQALDEGCVYDSNRYTIYGMLQRLGCDVIDMGVVRDDPQALERALRAACESADAIVTSGGVSVGAADYTRDIMERLGDVAFWKLAMRPGRPLAFGRIASDGRSAILFGLPGNPVAVMVSFYFFARDALLRMMGAEAPLPQLKARCAATIRKKPGRTEFQRGILATGADGMPEVRLTGAQGSGILRSMSEANCMVVLGDGQGTVQVGELVDVVLFDGLI
ncbi:gephyrin-like molybdotransferase Glp [uncultured Massilia sp.]|uniref:molybdopterin molybdotransferase MoeA n=1 Tax=uncultured Massilia sp. TaxID=169973 RepID=UPI0025EC4690|nr:gephyrin-like molybdotransferase Glp [uncultured Massilia sp.]